MSCEKFVIWRLCAILIIALLDVLILYIGKILDLLFGISGPYSILSFFVFIATALILGYVFQKKGIRNMWKSPLDKPQTSGSSLASTVVSAGISSAIPPL